MDSNDIKQIIIAHHAIESAIEAMRKPAIINLNDAETMSVMPRTQEDTLWHILTACGDIQSVLKKMDYISDLEKDVDADEELAEAGEMIKDILFDVQPKPNHIIKGIMRFHDMVKVAKDAGL